MSTRDTIKCMICFFVGLISTGLLYYIIIDRKALPNNIISQIDYRNILFNSIPTPRIIIDSGSNSFWSIVPQIIEDKFKIPTIVVSENGNVPFDMKMNRLKAYTRPGDIILLPYEWIYYSRKDYTSNFMESVFGITKSDNTDHNIIYNYTYHYYFLSMLDRVKFIFQHSNPAYVVRGLIQRYREPSIQHQVSLRISALLYNLDNNPAGDVKNDSNRLRDRSSAAQSCHQYLNATPLNDLSELKKIMHSLNQLQKEKNNKIIITWPAVAGADCYVEQEVEKLSTQIKNVAESFELSVVGSPFESSFPESNMLDTHYHVDSNAALLRTKRLLTHLDNLVVLNNNNFIGPKTIQLAKEVIQENLLVIDEKKLAFLQPLKTGEYKLSAPNFYDYFYLPQSEWYPNEGWGQWSKGEKSKIYLKLTNNDCKIKLNGKFFAESYSEIISNNFVNSTASALSIINFTQNKGTVNIEIYNRNTTSPNEIGASKDNRKLGFGLEGISVSC